jgi:hypothetical protein
MLTSLLPIIIGSEKSNNEVGMGGVSNIVISKVQDAAAAENL